MLYQSLENQKIKDMKKLQQRKYRDKTGLFLIEGEHLVKEAYQAGTLVELLLEEGIELPLKVPTNYVTHEVISYLSKLEDPSPIIGICKKKTPSTIFGKRIVALDAIQDPGNLGTILRSAVAFHADMILLGEGTVDVYNDKVIRASQGMIFHIPIISVNLEEVLSKLKDEGYQILGTKVTGGKVLKEVEKTEKSVIIMGNEGSGMSTTLCELCSQFIYIPMSSICESLNVGVATSIILYELDK